MGSAIADRANGAGGPGEHQTAALPFDPAKSAKADLAVIVAVIGPDHRILEFERGGIGQRQAMLGNVDGIFRRVEFDLHKLYVGAFERSRKFYMLLRLMGARGSRGVALGLSQRIRCIANSAA